MEPLALAAEQLPVDDLPCERVAEGVGVLVRRHLAHQLLVDALAKLVDERPLGETSRCMEDREGKASADHRREGERRTSFGREAIDAREDRLADRARDPQVRDLLPVPPGRRPVYVA